VPIAASPIVALPITRTAKAPSTNRRRRVFPPRARSLAVDTQRQGPDTILFLLRFTIFFQFFSLSLSLFPPHFVSVRLLLFLCDDQRKNSTVRLFVILVFTSTRLSTKDEFASRPSSAISTGRSTVGGLYRIIRFRVCSLVAHGETSVVRGL